jgi:polyphosphate kinase
VYLDELVPALAADGIAIVGWDDLDAVDRKRMTEVYEQRIFPVLTPLAVDPSHPFPYISELALSVGAMVAHPDPDNDDRRFARVKVPTVFPACSRSTSTASSPPRS